MVILLAVLTIIAETARIADRTLALVRNLSNHIEFPDEELARAATESVPFALHATDAKAQLQMIEQLSEGDT